MGTLGGVGAAFPDGCGWVLVRPGFWFHGASARSCSDGSDGSDKPFLLEISFLSTAERRRRYEWSRGVLFLWTGAVEVQGLALVPRIF